MVSHEAQWSSMCRRADQYSGGYFLDLNMAQLPLGCDLHFGKKLYGYLHAGAWLNYLYSKQKGDVKFPHFQAGITGGIGMGYRINSSWAIDILYEAEYGLSPLYQNWLRTSAGPWGISYLEDEYLPFRTLTLSLKIALGRRNSQSKKALS